jgi:hypothetical protein
MRSRETVCIAIPHNGTIDAQMTLDLVSLMRDRRTRIDSLQLVHGTGLLARTRNLIVKNFLDDSNADWLLMVDSDQSLPISAFDLLVESAHKDDRPVIAGLVFAAFYDNQVLRPVPAIYNISADGAMLPIDDYTKNSLVQIDGSGTGCILVHRDVLVAIRAKATPNQGTDWCWFFDGAIEGRWFSEDLLFCRKILALGFPIFCHTGAILGHHKQFWLDERQHDQWKSENKI